jgi:hypothetical protein
MFNVLQQDGSVNGGAVLMFAAGQECHMEGGGYTMPWACRVTATHWLIVSWMQ